MVVSKMEAICESLVSNGARPKMEGLNTVERWDRGEFKISDFDDNERSTVSLIDDRIVASAWDAPLRLSCGYADELSWRLIESEVIGM